MSDRIGQSAASQSRYRDRGSFAGRARCIKESHDHITVIPAQSTSQKLLTLLTESAGRFLMHRKVRKRRVRMASLYHRQIQRFAEWFAIVMNDIRINDLGLDFEQQRLAEACMETELSILREDLESDVRSDSSSDD